MKIKKILLFIFSLFFMISLVSCEEAEDAISNASESDIALPSDGNEASSDISTPSEDNETPSGDISLPSIDDETPSDDNEASSDISLPSIDNETPSGDISLPSIDNETPSIEDSDPSDEEDENSSVGNKVISAVLDQINEANTITFNYDISYEDTSREVYYSGYNDVSTKNTSDYTSTMDLDVDVTVSKTEESYNIHIIGNQISTSKEIYYMNDEYVDTYNDEYSEIIDIYYVDNALYVYDQDSESYIISNPNILNTVVQTVVELLNKSNNIDVTVKNDVAEILGEYFDLMFSIQNNMLSITTDYKAMYNALVEYVNGISGDASLKSVINDLLSYVDESLTLEVILDEIELVADMTLQQLIDEINEWLTVNFNTTIDDIHAAICDNETMMSYIRQIFANISTDDPDLFMQEFKDFKFKEILEPHYNAKIFDLISPILDDDPSDDVVPTFNDVRAMAEDFFDLKINDVFYTRVENEDTGEVYYNYQLDQLKETLANTTVTEYNQTIDVKFNNLFKIDSVLNTANADYKFDDGEEMRSVKQTSKVTINLSNEITNIELPENANIVKLGFLVDCYSYDTQNNVIDYISFSEDGTNGHIEYNRDKATRYYNTSDEFTCMYDIRFDVTKIENDVYYCTVTEARKGYGTENRITITTITDENLTSTEFTIIVDEDGFTYSIENLPEYKYAMTQPSA